MWNFTKILPKEYLKRKYKNIILLFMDLKKIIFSFFLKILLADFYYVTIPMFLYFYYFSLEMFWLQSNRG